MTANDRGTIPLKPRMAGALIPLPAFHQRLWSKLAKQGLPSYRGVGEASLRIRGPLDIELLRAVLHTVIDRHESLRTRFVAVDGIPQQQVDEAQEIDLPIVDLSGFSPAKKAGDVNRMLEEFFRETVDLSVGPLIAARLLRLAADEHLLVLGIDHITTDAASCAIVRNEIRQLYQQSAGGLPSSLPRIGIQFPDYAIWQQQTREDWQAKHEPYWRKRLHNMPPFNLPSENRQVERDCARVLLDFPLGERQSAKLAELALRQRVLLPVVVLSLMLAVVSRWSGLKDLLVTFVSHGRHGRPQLINTTGLIANHLFLRIEISQDDTLQDLLKKVDLEFHAAHHHEDFDRLPDFIPGCVRTLSFNWMGSHWTRRSAVQPTTTEGGTTIEPFPIRLKGGQEQQAVPYLYFISWPNAYDTSEGIVVTVMYQTDHYARSTVECLGRNLRAFADELIQRQLTTLASLPFHM